ncbi:MAG: flagellar basal body rod protein FlgC [Candidatus Sericytochromatia bacterium]
MSLDDTFQIAGSALSAQRLRMNTISNNLANAQTTRTADGTPYRRQQVVFRPMFEQTLLQRLRLSATSDRHLPFEMPAEGGGVRVSQVLPDQREGRQVYEPGHPHANAEGYVSYPNVNVIEEMTDMISASRSYEANVTAVQTLKAMALKALEIGRA